MSEFEREWHLWFAWHPIRLDDSGNIAWLRFVLRADEFGRGGHYYVYQEPK